MLKTPTLLELVVAIPFIYLKKEKLLLKIEAPKQPGFHILPMIRFSNISVEVIRFLNHLSMKICVAVICSPILLL